MRKTKDNTNIIGKQLNNIITKFYDKNKVYNWKGYHRYYGYLFSIYLDKTYVNVCSWRGFSISFNPMIYKSAYTMTYINSILLTKDSKYIEELKTYVKKCNKRFIVFPIVVLFHQNIVIVDTEKNEIELFDSYGNEFENEAIKRGLFKKGTYNLYINQIKDLFNNIFNERINKFYKPVDFFPENLDLQNKEILLCSKENYKVNSWGFCVVWSLMYAELRISNPDINRNGLIKSLMNSFNYSVKTIKHTLRYSNKKSIKFNNVDICKFIRAYTLFLRKLHEETSIFDIFKINMSLPKEIDMKYGVRYPSLIEFYINLIFSMK